MILCILVFLMLYCRWKLFKVDRSIQNCATLLLKFAIPNKLKKWKETGDNTGISQIWQSNVTMRQREHARLSITALTLLWYKANSKCPFTFFCKNEWNYVSSVFVSHKEIRFVAAEIHKFFFNYADPIFKINWMSL